MPVKAPVVITNTWDGFYLGVNAGTGYLQDTMSFTQDPSCNLANPACVNNASFDPVSYNGKNWGFAGGLHGGYNFALTPSWVIGVEADWNKTEVGTGGGQVGLTFAGANVGPCFQVAFVSNAGNCQGLLMSDNLNWTASVRGRLGWTLGSMMLYGTGGAAWASHELSGQIAASGSPAPIGNVPFTTASILTSGNHTNGGWVGGGGIEFMATAAWILRLEYLHYQFHSALNTTVPCSACIPGVAFAGAGHFGWTNETFDVVRAGLSYKFNPGWWTNLGFGQ
jgi:outer membrane immunogenic protein